MSDLVVIFDPLYTLGEFGKGCTQLRDLAADVLQRRGGGLVRRQVHEDPDGGAGREPPLVLQQAKCPLRCAEGDAVLHREVTICRKLLPHLELAAADFRADRLGYPLVRREAACRAFHGASVARMTHLDMRHPIGLVRVQALMTYLDLCHLNGEEQLR